MLFTKEQHVVVSRDSWESSGNAERSKRVKTTEVDLSESEATSLNNFKERLLLAKMHWLSTFLSQGKMRLNEVWTLDTDLL
jgi:hypothetical protein